MSNLNPDISFAEREGEAARATALKKAAHAFATELLKQTPSSANQTLAYRSIEDAVLRGIAAQEQEKDLQAAAREANKQQKKNAA